MQNIQTYITLFFIYAVLGWIVEVFFTLIYQKKFVNRGFLIGPYVPLYGVGGLFVTLLLKNDISDPTAVFLKSAVVCGSLEYVVSLVMEKIFKARWWDYNGRKFNINGRVCLFNLFLFGVGCTLALYVFNPILLQVIFNVPRKLLIVLNMLLLLIFLSDFIITLVILLKIKNKIKFRFKSKDATEEITELTKKELIKSSALIKRIVLSFPDVQILYKKITKKL